VYDRNALDTYYTQFTSRVIHTHMGYIITMRDNDPMVHEAVLKPPTLVPGGLYQLNRIVYPPDRGSQFKDGLWYPLADYDLWDDDKKPELFSQSCGIYTGTQRINNDIRRPKSKGGPRRIRKLVHVFLWGGNQVILQSGWVKRANAA
jgi:hypothetical protein